MKEVSILWCEPIKRSLHKNASANGDGAVFTLQGSYGQFTFQVNGITGTATLTFQASIDGENFEDVRVQDTADGTFATTATSDGIYTLYLSGAHSLKVPITNYDDGGNITVTVVARPL